MKVHKLLENKKNIPTGRVKSLLKERLNFIEETIQKDHRYSDIMNESISSKIGNTLGALRYVEYLQKLDELAIKAIIAFQLLADIVDSIIDSERELDSEEISQLYKLQTTNLSVLDNLKSDINLFLSKQKTEAMELFDKRYSGFIAYQAISAKKSEEDYGKALKNFAKEDEFFQKDNEIRKIGGLEYAASKGGTTYFHNLIVRMVNNDLKDLNQFHLANTWFDLLNAMSDHTVDILENQQFENYKDYMSNQKSTKLLRQNNPLKIILDDRAKSRQILRKDYEKEVARYFIGILEKSYKIVEMDAYNFDLLTDMLLFFFQEDKPTPYVQKEVIDRIKYL